MLDMQAKQVELAIDPIQQKLAEYADHAADKLFELIDADAETVQRQAAKDILEMAGYTPKRNVKEEKQADTTIIVGQMNVGGDHGESIKESILEHSGSGYTPTEVEFTEEPSNGEQHNGTDDGFQEQGSDVQVKALPLQRTDLGQGRGEREVGTTQSNGIQGGQRVQRSNESDEERISSKPGTRWLSDQAGGSSFDV